jgi:hypothetical protein
MRLETSHCETCRLSLMSARGVNSGTVAAPRPKWRSWRRKVAGPLMHARVGMLRALNRDVERVFNSDRKDTNWGKRKLKRDE